MSYYRKVGPGRYKHPEKDAHVQFDLTTSTWMLDFPGHPQHGERFRLKRDAQEATKTEIVPKVEPEEITLHDYWQAPGGKGQKQYTWDEKPHRLLYELIHEVVRCRDILSAHGISTANHPNYERQPLYRVNLTKYKIEDV